MNFALLRLRWRLKMLPLAGKYFAKHQREEKWIKRIIASVNLALPTLIKWRLASKYSFYFILSMRFRIEIWTLRIVCYMRNNLHSEREPLKIAVDDGGYLVNACNKRLLSTHTYLKKTWSKLWMKKHAKIQCTFWDLAVHQMVHFFLLFSKQYS